MQNILVFTTDCKGHHLEYLHHIYSHALNDIGNRYVFCVSSDFNDVKTLFSWPEARNISFEIIDDHDLKKCISGGNGFLNIIKLSFSKSFYLRKKCLQYSIDRVYTIMLMEYLPALPFVLSPTVDFRGIIYRIALNDKNLSLSSRIIEKIKYKLLAKSKIFKKVFVLNDKKSAQSLNKIYKVDKFTYIPDPIPITFTARNLRVFLHIPAENKVFLHFGGLSLRKGTITILEAIAKVKDTKKMTFIFAGQISEDCKEEFYRKYLQLKEKKQVLVYDEFCTYEFLSSLAYTSDYILIPYQNVNQSSGVLGYAAQYDKPVIGPNAGLLGEIIKDYGLGKTIDYPVTIEKLAKAIENSDNIVRVNAKKYREENSIENFIKTMAEII